MQEGWTSLERAVSNGKSDVATMLITRGAKLEATDQVGPRACVSFARNRGMVVTDAHAHARWAVF